MKRIIICAFIAILLIILGIAIYICTDNALSDTEQAVNDISLSFEEGASDKVKSLSRRLSEDWRQTYGNYLFIIDKNYIVEITLAISRIEALAQDGDKEILTECETVNGLLELCREKENIELRNII